jgi:hypothetical protein
MNVVGRSAAVGSTAHRTVHRLVTVSGPDVEVNEAERWEAGDDL